MNKFKTAYFKKVNNLQNGDFTLKPWNPKKESNTHDQLIFNQKHKSWTFGQEEHPIMIFLYQLMQIRSMLGSVGYS